MKQTNQPESDLPKLSAPAHRALASVGISNLQELSKFTEGDIKKLHGMGPTGIKALKESLTERGLDFAPKK